MIGKQNPKLEWAKQTEPRCEIASGTGHQCDLIKKHKNKKHSCSCGREWYGNYT